MSVRAMTHVWDLRGLSDTQRLVALALADHADHDGRNAYPSVDTLALKTELHRRTVQRALADLVARGILEIEHEHSRHRPRTYRFVGVADGHPSTAPEVIPTESPGVAAGTPRGGARSREGWHTRHPNRPRTVREPKERPAADFEPTDDQHYLSQRIVERWDAKPSSLSTSVLRRWNRTYGTEAVTSALRTVHGFPPSDGIDKPFAYLAAVLAAEDRS